LQTLSAITPNWESAVGAHCHNSIGLPPTDQPDYPMMNFGSILAANAANYAGFAGFTGS